MRLKEYQIIGLLDSINAFKNSYEIDIRLYGSRVDDNKSGGDIDLLVVCNDKEGKAHLKSKKLNIIIKMHEAIGEQKIDLTIVDKDDLETDPFISMIYPTSIPLSPPHTPQTS